MAIIPMDLAIGKMTNRSIASVEQSTSDMVIAKEFYRSSDMIHAKKTRETVAPHQSTVSDNANEFAMFILPSTLKDVLSLR
jgi:hypothetical protein